MESCEITTSVAKRAQRILQEMECAPLDSAIMRALEIAAERLDVEDFFYLISCVEGPETDGAMSARAGFAHKMLQRVLAIFGNRATLTSCFMKARARFEAERSALVCDCRYASIRFIEDYLDAVDRQDPWCPRYDAHCEALQQVWGAVSCSVTEYLEPIAYPWLDEDEMAS